MWSRVFLPPPLLIFLSLHMQDVPLFTIVNRGHCGGMIHFRAKSGSQLMDKIRINICVYLPFSHDELNPLEKYLHLPLLFVDRASVFWPPAASAKINMWQHRCWRSGQISCVSSATEILCLVFVHFFKKECMQIYDYINTRLIQLQITGRSHTLAFACGCLRVTHRVSVHTRMCPIQKDKAVRCNTICSNPIHLTRHFRVDTFIPSSNDTGE